MASKIRVTVVLPESLVVTAGPGKITVSQVLEAVAQHLRYPDSVNLVLRLRTADGRGLGLGDVRPGMSLADGDTLILEAKG